MTKPIHPQAITMESKFVQVYVDQIAQLFVQVADPGNPRPCHTDASTGALVTQDITVAHKAIREIDEAICHLASPANFTLPGSPEHNHVFYPAAKTRTITLLVGLKYFLQSLEGFDPQGTSCPPDSEDSQFPFNDTLEIGSSTWFAPQQLKVSLLLLLVHAAKYAQIAWPRDVLWEYISAVKAHESLERFLTHVCKRGYSQEVLNAVFHLVRWHTLHGQFHRNSSTLGVDTLIQHGVQENLRPFFIAFAYADGFLRQGNSMNEFAVEENLRSQVGLRHLLRSEFARKQANESGMPEPIQFWCEEESLKRRPDDHLLIQSYGRGPMGRLFDTPHSRPEARPTEPPVIYHHSFLRSQAQAGLLSTVEQENELSSDEGLKLAYLRKEKVIDYAPQGLRLHEMASVTTLHPAFLACHQYGLKLDLKTFYCGRSGGPTGDSVAAVFVFLSACFDAALRDPRFRRTLPFPLVKRLTDLCSAFNDIEASKTHYSSDRSTGTNPPVFRATFEFDGGTARAQRFDLFLPDVKDETHLATLQPPAPDVACSFQRTADVLTRFLCTFVTNYGMLANWRSLDIDFSASCYSHPDMPSFWRERMRKGMSDLGLHIFERYLENVAGGILQTSHARLPFRRVLDEQTVDEPVCLPKGIAEYGESLVDKYAIGIDVGGTATKIQFFKIVRNQRDQNGNQGKVAARIAKAAGPDGPENDILLRQDDTGYSIPTRKSIPRNPGEAVYENARAFTRYILAQLLSRMKRQYGDGEAGQIKDKLTNTVVLSLTWPGPIVENRIAGVSGILKMFGDVGNKAFTGAIMVDQIDRIKAIDLAEALREEFLSLIKKEYPNKEEYHLIESQAKALSVALVNDGDAEALGTFVSRIANDPGWKDWFSHHAVAVAKAGTGTGGAVIANGRLFGLNEFGKLIIDLAADNTDNDRKSHPDERWPVGDVNKRFSIKSLRDEASRLGAEGAEVEGLDLEILLGGSSGSSPPQSPEEATLKFSEEAILRFGALELCCIATPNIDYNDLVKSITASRQGAGMTKSLKYAKDVGLELVPACSDDAELDRITVFELATNERVRGLGITAGNHITLLGLLTKLGNYRIDRLKLPNLLDKERWEETKTIGKRMGQGLADLAALLYDFYGVRTFFMAGGPVRGDRIGEACYQSLKESVAYYLCDRYHLRGVSGDCEGMRQVVGERRRGEDATTEPKPVDCKLWTARDNESYGGMLGAAMKGVFQYLEDQKIRELQEMKRRPDSEQNLVFVSAVEAERLRASATVPQISSLEPYPEAKPR